MSRQRCVRREARAAAAQPAMTKTSKRTSIERGENSCARTHRVTMSLTSHAMLMSQA